MRISTSLSGDATTLRIHATRLDAAIAPELRARLGEAITTAAGPTIVDLSEVAFLDSSGLGALIGALKVAGAAKLQITGLTPAVRTVFRLTRVDRAFTIVE
jgi:anti-sigma B factor antagonist